MLRAGFESLIKLEFITKYVGAEMHHEVGLQMGLHCTCNNPQASTKKCFVMSL